MNTDQRVKFYQKNPDMLRDFINTANDEADRMFARIKELEAGIREVIRQADMLPAYEKPRGRVQWMVNNQRQWIIMYAQSALDGGWTE